MALGVARRPRFTFGGWMVVAGADGHPRRFKRGDELPEGLVSDRELAVLLESGWLIDPDAKPAPRPAPAPPRLPSPLEIFQTIVEPRAQLDGDQITGVPGCAVTIAQKARDVDFKRVTEPSREARRVLVHRAGDGWAATVDLVQLADLLAGRRLMR